MQFLFRHENMLQSRHKLVRVMNKYFGKPLKQEFFFNFLTLSLVNPLFAAMRKLIVQLLLNANAGT